MRKIAIDPGHFGGELSRLENRHFQFPGFPPLKEGDLNLRVALKLEELLIHAGFEVHLTRRACEKFAREKSFSKDEFEDFRKNNLKVRAAGINDFNPDFAISIHFNASCYSSTMSETVYNGVMTFIANRTDRVLVSMARRIASVLAHSFELGFCEKKWFLEEVSNLWEDLGDGVNVRDLAIMRTVRSRIVLTEGPFLNNREVYRSLVRRSDLVDTYARSLLESLTGILC